MRKNLNKNFYYLINKIKIFMQNLKKNLNMIQYTLIKNNNIHKYIIKTNTIYKIAKIVFLNVNMTCINILILKKKNKNNK